MKDFQWGGKDEDQKKTGSSGDINHFKTFCYTKVIAKCCYTNI